jgi:hypothetical protein
VQNTPATPVYTQEYAFPILCDYMSDCRFLTNNSAPLNLLFLISSHSYRLSCSRGHRICCFCVLFQSTNFQGPCILIPSVTSNIFPPQLHVTLLPSLLQTMACQFHCAQCNRLRSFLIMHLSQPVKVVSYRTQKVYFVISVLAYLNS